MCVCVCWYVYVGFLCVGYPELMLETDVRELYLSWLAKDAQLKMKLQVEFCHPRFNVYVHIILDMVHYTPVCTLMHMYII